MYLLVGDLCRIYNVRANGWSTGLILVRVFVNTVAASHLEGLTEQLGDQVSEHLSDSIAAAAQGRGVGFQPRGRGGDQRPLA